MATRMMKKGRDVLDVPECFQDARLRDGWEFADGERLPSPMMTPKGSGATFGPPAAVGTGTPAPAADPAETAAQRHARKNGAAPAAEPGKE